MVHRDTAKRLRRQQDRLAQLRQSALRRSKGVFKVAFSARGTTGQLTPFPAGTLLSMVGALREQFPTTTVESARGLVYAWSDDAALATRLLEIATLAAVSVTAESRTELFWGRI